MKKIISSILVCVMCICLLTPAFAADESTKPQVTFYSKNIKTNPGEDFNIEVNIKDNPGISNYFIILEYDTELFDLTSNYEGERCDFSNSILQGVINMSNEHYEENQASALAIVIDNVTDDGQLFSYRFTAKDKVADTTVKVFLREIGHIEDTYDLYDIYFLIPYNTHSYNVDVSIGTDTELSEESSISLDYMTDKEFADGYEEMMEQRNTPKPTPNWIGVTEPSDSSSSSSDVSRNFELVKNEDTSAYMAPVTDDTFEPDRLLTRYETVDVLSKIFTVKNAQDKNDFTDVLPEYEKAVNAFAQAGVISGYGESSSENAKLFKGELNITRAEFVKLMTDTFNIPAATNGETAFTDISSHWAKDYIAAFTQAGYISGYLDNTFRPDNNITRAEAVVIVNNLLGIDALSADEKVEKVFSDLPDSHWAYNIIGASFRK